VVRDAALEVVRLTGSATWEVNLWALAESRLGWRWRRGSHGETIFDCVYEALLEMESGAMDLAALFREHGTDKDACGYTNLYTVLFEPLRHRELVLVEVGIGTVTPGAYSSMHGYMPDTYRPGASLRAWREFFPRAKVHGLDIQPDTQLSGEARITTHLVDSTSAEQVAALPLAPRSVDIIVDDAGHDHRNQLATLRNTWPLLKDGGYYIIEDIYQGSPLANGDGAAELKAACEGSVLFFAGLLRNVAVMLKRPLDTRPL